MLQHSPANNYQKTQAYKSKKFGHSEREELITSHLSKVKFIADRIAIKLPPSVEKDDLYGAGVIGLIDAVERFDPTKGIAFTTFAEMRVRGAILDSLRALDWASRSTRRRIREVQKAYDEIERKNGRPAKEEEVAEHLEISIAELHKVLQEMSGLKLNNLDEREEDTGLSLMDTISDKGASPIEELEYTERRRLLTEAVNFLPEREKKVISLYYVEELNMKEIAVILEVTESRVSQLRTQAIIRLRGYIAKNS